MIEADAFSGCSGFTGSLTLPSSVTTIGPSAFRGCSGFTGSLTIPNSVTTIGSYAFDGCSGFTGSLTLPSSVTTIGNDAFRGCSGFTGSLTLPSSVTDIYNGAFYGCSGLTEIWSKSTSAPWVQNSNVFYEVDKTIPVHVPCGSTSNYQYASNWSAFTNYVENPAVLIVKSNNELLGYASVTKYGNCNDNASIVQAMPYMGTFANWTTPDGTMISTDATFTFELTEDMILTANFEPTPNLYAFVGGSTTDHWDDPNNWVPNELPTATSTVNILANVEVNVDACVQGLTVYGDYVVTISPDAKLTVTESLISPAASSIVVEEGGQLVHANGGVLATVKKSITPYTPGQKDGWHLIASPLASTVNVSEVQSLTNVEYDLYYYDEPTVYWINHEDASNDFTELENGKGYLYGNNQEINLGFVGELQNGSITVTVPLSYTEGPRLAGFNLVGNPFAHNVTSYASENVANGCYVMNEAKDDLIVSEISEANPLKPAEGFFVKATAADASITFNPQRGNLDASDGTIRLELAENNKVVDRLLVKTVEGQPLEKLSLNEHRTKLFAQGERQELAIVPCEGNEQIVNFKAAKNGNYTITVNADGLEFNYLHLVDNLTGADVDLLVEPNYTFEARTSDYASRFLLRFIMREGGESESENFVYFFNDKLVVANEGKATLQVVDLLGHILSSEQINGSCEKQIVAAPGVYMLRLVNGKDVKMQKIVVR